MWREALLALVPALPATAAIGMTLWMLAGSISISRGPALRALTERTVARVATASLVLSLAALATSIALWQAARTASFVARLGQWFSIGEDGFDIVFLLDGSSAPVAMTASVLVLATARFSVSYLHREPGFVRFFLLMLTFAAAIQATLLSGSLDLLFAGWEVVGLCSVLLVAFFHERRGPVRAAIRVLVTYRVADIGLVVATVLMHRAYHTTVFSDAAHKLDHGGSMPVAGTALGLAIAIAAIGKSAQFPLGGWLPRAMEGPTASSAVFYGGLSVHAGVFLLIRAAPFIESSLVTRGALIAIGLITAIMATLSAQVTADAKTGLAYATIAQVGLMFVECGLGLTTVALVHLVTHAILRYYQFLRTPSVLQDALARRGAVGATLADEAAARWELLGVGARRFLYRLAIERFETEAALDRVIVRPFLRLSALLDRVEKWAFAYEPVAQERPEDGEKQR